MVGTGTRFAKAPSQAIITWMAKLSTSRKAERSFESSLLLPMYNRDIYRYNEVIDSSYRRSKGETDDLFGSGGGCYGRDVLRSNPCLLLL